MPDIFISYAHEDRAVAQKLAAAIEAQGWSVFWDRNIPAGQTWRSFVGKALENARCVVVTWSTASTGSDWVHEEANDAKRRGILIPVFIESVAPPIGFREIQAADLAHWNGDTLADSFVKFRDDIASMIGVPPKPVEDQEGQPAQADHKAEDSPRTALAAISGGTEMQAIETPSHPRPRDLQTSQSRKWTLRLPVMSLVAVLSVAFWFVSVQGPPSPSPESPSSGNVGPTRDPPPPTRDVDPPVPKKPVGFRPCAGCPEMVRLGPGSFEMGSPASEEFRDTDEGPQHEVNVSAFAIGTAEVTFDEYDLFANATGQELPNDNGMGRNGRPVINVSWNDAVAYAKWLSEENGLSFRLPSEAEWEYAARAGTTTSYWWGKDVQAQQRAWANCKSCGSPWDGYETAPVRSFAPNAFGLYDTSGNVSEWVQDCYFDTYEGSKTDGSAREKPDCSVRVIRSLSWFSPAEAMRSANRSKSFDGNVYLGFRLALDQ